MNYDNKNYSIEWRSDLPDPEINRPRYIFSPLLLSSSLPSLRNRPNILPSYRYLRSAVKSPAGFRNRIWCIFGLKMRRLVATISMISKEAENNLIMQFKQ